MSNQHDELHHVQLVIILSNLCRLITITIISGSIIRINTFISLQSYHLIIASSSST